jgi:hypothetical protein
LDSDGDEGAAVVNVELAVVADYASVSENKLNILGIFREVRAEELPVAVPHLYLVVTFEAEPAEYGKEWSIRIVLRENHDGDQLLSLEGPVQVPQPLQPGDRVYVNQVVGLTGIRFEHEGDYSFSVMVDDNEKASIPLSVYKLE